MICRTAELRRRQRKKLGEAKIPLHFLTPQYITDTIYIRWRTDDIQSGVKNSSFDFFLRSLHLIGVEGDGVSSMKREDNDSTKTLVITSLSNNKRWHLDHQTEGI